MRGSILDWTVGWTESDSFKEGTMGGCCKVKRVRVREDIAESAVVGRRVAGRCDVREYGSAVDGRTLALSGAIERCGKLGMLVRAVEGRQRARSEWRRESPELLELPLDRVGDARGAVRLAWSGEVAFMSGSESESVGTVRCRVVRR